LASKRRPHQSPPPAPRVPVSSNPALFPEASRALRKLAPITRDEYDQLDEDEEEHAFTVSGVQQADLVTDVWDAIGDAVVQGTVFEDFQDAVGEKLYDDWGAPNAPRLETIFRTAVNQAYNDGREAIYRKPAVMDVRPYWRYVEIDDGDICELCESCGGVVRAADDDWWDEHRPPLHPRCRCSFEAMTALEAYDEGLITAEDAGIDPDVAKGFGSDRDDDWHPDLSAYPDEIGDHLGDVLEQS